MPGNRNKLFALLIVLLIFGGIGFYIVWGIMLNKGTVVFSFERPPFTALFGEETKICHTGECEFWIPVGPRLYNISKEGYYEKSGSVNVIRDKRIIEDIRLEFIPQTTPGVNYSIFQLPAGYSKFSDSLKAVSLFSEFPADYSLKSLPKIINNIVFSETGDKAVIFETGKVTLYSTRDFTVKPLDSIMGSVSAVFSADETKVYAVSYDEASKKYALKRVYITEDKPIESLIYFARDVKNYELSIAGDEKYVALTDKTFSPEILYIIDLQNSSRTNVFEGYLIENGRWSNAGEVYIFRGKNLNDTFSGLFYYDSALNKVEKLSFDTSVYNIDFTDGEAIFVTSQPYSITNSQVPYSIQFEEKITASTYEGMIAESEAQKSSILVKWDIKENLFYLVKDLSGLIADVPEKIELSQDGKTVRMLIQGLVYDIIIQE